MAGSQTSFLEPAGEKVIVEHTNINPNKAAHIGHLRNAALGDTFVRLLRPSGRQVEVQNYIDNTGVQVADVVVGFQQLRQLSLDAGQGHCLTRSITTAGIFTPEVPIGFPRTQPGRSIDIAALKEIEEGREKRRRWPRYVADRIVHAHLETMLRIDVEYDVLPRESEILHLRFWDEAFQKLKEHGTISFAEEGPSKGCWIMPLPGDERTEMADEKIIVRSNGTVTYVGKDIAYQLWKFGLLDKRLQLSPVSSVSGRAHRLGLQPPSPAPGAACRNSARGGAFTTSSTSASRTCRTSSCKVCGDLGYEQQADKSIHFSYEMVALSPACCVDLGIELSAEDRSPPYVEVSGRKGLGVKADDLIDKLIEKSLDEVMHRQPDLRPRAPGHRQARSRSVPSAIFCSSTPAIPSSRSISPRL